MNTSTLDRLWSSTRSRFLHKKRTARSRTSSAISTDFVVVPANMGKSNKFDYTNRDNHGVAFGQIIGKALLKDAEKVKADAERHLRKARKQSIGSPNGARESTSTKHTIDLKVPNKALGDDGVCALADGLEAALRSGDAAASLALEDLNLTGNGITTSG